MQSQSHDEKKAKSSISFVGLMIAVIVVLVATGGFMWWRAVNYQGEDKPLGAGEPKKIYSTLTGLEIDNEELNKSPTFCVQIPNGSTDGARPQAGLAQAAVVFEAIAEQGITRFAAVFQNVDLAVLGPVRSLRPYYLDWDTPFGCTVVHAGGSDEALAGIQMGGQRDLDIDALGMGWRENGTGRWWNNLFTSTQELLQYNSSKGYTTSEVKGFLRMVPEDAEDRAEERGCVVAEAEDGQESCYFSPADHIQIDFTNWNTTHNVYYDYDAVTNSYLRSYVAGGAHMSYECAAGATRPVTTSCVEVQVAPKVVVVMWVQESTMADGYHEQIKTAGSGKAVVYQNGEEIAGTWEKKSQAEQIRFLDTEGKEIALAPGQVFIEAVGTTYGKVRATAKE